MTKTKNYCSMLTADSIFGDFSSLFDSVCYSLAKPFTKVSNARVGMFSSLIHDETIERLVDEHNRSITI